MAVVGAAPPTMGVCVSARASVCCDVWSGARNGKRQIVSQQCDAKERQTDRATLRVCVCVCENYPLSSARAASQCPDHAPAAGCGHAHRRAGLN